MSTRLLAALPIVLLSACIEGTLEAPRSYCDYAESPLAFEDTFIGMTGQAALDAVPRERSGAMGWEDETSASFTLALDVDTSTLRGRTGTAVYPDPGPRGSTPSMGVECPGQIAVDATLALSTDDGRLDESVPVTFTITDGDPSRLGLSAELDPAALTGALDMDDFLEPGRYDDITIFLSIAVNDRTGVVEGAMHAEGEGSGGGGSDTDVVYSERTLLGEAVSGSDAE